MPKLKPMKFSDYSSMDRFHHNQTLDQLIVDLYKKGIVKSCSGQYTASSGEFTIRFECNRLLDVINHDCPLNLINASLSTWVGNCNSHTTVSHTMIDKTTLFTLLKLLS